MWARSCARNALLYGFSSCILINLRALVMFRTAKGPSARRWTALATDGRLLATCWRAAEATPKQSTWPYNVRSLSAMPRRMNGDEGG